MYEICIDTNLNLHRYIHMYVYRYRYGQIASAGVKKWALSTKTYIYVNMNFYLHIYVHMYVCRYWHGRTARVGVTKRACKPNKCFVSYLFIQLYIFDLEAPFFHSYTSSVRLHLHEYICIYIYASTYICIDIEIFVWSRRPFDHIYTSSVRLHLYRCIYICVYKCKYIYTYRYR